MQPPQVLRKVGAHMQGTVSGALECIQLLIATALDRHPMKNSMARLCRALPRMKSLHATNLSPDKHASISWLYRLVELLPPSSTVSFFTHHRRRCPSIHLRGTFVNETLLSVYLNAYSHIYRSIRTSEPGHPSLANSS